MAASSLQLTGDWRRKIRKSGNVDYTRRGITHTVTLRITSLEPAVNKYVVYTKSPGGRQDGCRKILRTFAAKSRGCVRCVADVLQFSVRRTHQRIAANGILGNRRRATRRYFSDDQPTFLRSGELKSSSGRSFLYTTKSKCRIKLSGHYLAEADTRKICVVVSVFPANKQTLDAAAIWGELSEFKASMSG